MNVAAKIAKKIPHTSSAGKILRWPIRWIPNNVVVPVLGGINRGMRWITGAGTSSSLWLGTYEEEQQRAVRQLVRPGMVAYDVGANAGFYTLALSQLVGDSGKVISFEPDAKSANFLRRHIELNDLRNVTFVQSAVSDSTGLAAFTGWKLIRSGSYLVPTISLDEFIAGGNPPPDFIKMDIEGAEVAALQGARQLLTKTRATWLIATHGDELNATCKTLLKQSGYRFTGFDCISESGPGDFVAFIDS